MALHGYPAALGGRQGDVRGRARARGGHSYRLELRRPAKRMIRARGSRGGRKFARRADAAELIRRHSDCDQRTRRCFRPDGAYRLRRSAGRRPFSPSWERPRGTAGSTTSPENTPSRRCARRSRRGSGSTRAGVETQNRLHHVRRHGGRAVAASHDVRAEATASGRAGGAGEARSSVGVAHTRDFLPEEIGRDAQIGETMQAVAAAMRDAGIDDARDVHFVQIKCPLLTSERVRGGGGARQDGGRPRAAMPRWAIRAAPRRSASPRRSARSRADVGEARCSGTGASIPPSPLPRPASSSCTMS